jgi:hypothetical protein
MQKLIEEKLLEPARSLHAAEADMDRNAKIRSLIIKLFPQQKFANDFGLPGKSKKPSRRSTATRRLL